jgi:hypothetical protein
VRVRRLIVAAILATCLVTPIIEAFDRWDHTLQDGYDTEATVVVVGLCFSSRFALAAPVPTGSPPTPIRI